MQESILIQVIKSFSQEELKSFGLYLEAAFFNTNKNVVKLYSAIKKYYPDFDDVKLKKEYLHKKIYPGETYSDERMRFLMSEMLRHALEYCEYKNNKQSNRINSKISFLGDLDNRKLDKIFLRNLKDLEQELNKKKNYDEDYFTNQLNLLVYKCNFYLERNMHRHVTDDALKLGKYKIYNFLISFIKSLRNLKNYQDYYNAKYHKNIVQNFLNNINFEQVIMEIKETSTPYYPVIAIYYYSVMTLIDPSNDSHLFTFKSLLEKNLNIFSRGEQHNLYLALESCLLRKSTGHKIEYKKILFGVYKDILKKGLHRLTPADHFRVSYFRNVFTVAVQLKEFEWATNFLNKYIKQVRPDFQLHIENFSIALLQFEKGNYEKSLECCSKISFNYFYLIVDVKNLMLRIYFELNSTEHAISLINSYRQFLNKNKMLTDRIKTSNKEFLKYYHALTKLKLNKDDYELRRIKNELQNGGQINHKYWLLEKIMQMEN